MNLLHLGKTGIRVTELCFGATTGSTKEPSEARAVQLLQKP